ncbi:MAG: 2-C-methyl-D-erythritol 4-phosphate cytidylyltransferase, partial [Paramuribaculum sp.]|nr:2-C-methyl-D-erythritol 4-phosphate cytidylyltransferase [Paramuribaculum sp.]
EPELIAVHDAVRPFATPELIRRVAEAAAECGAAIPVVVPADSFREVGPQQGNHTPAADGCTDHATGSDGAADDSHRIDRSRLRIVQTPQIFRPDWLRAAYRTPYDPQFTDDASVVEAAGHAVRLVEGERTNLKITTPDDFLLAEALLTVLEERDSEEHAPADEPAALTMHDRTDESSVATDRTTDAATENAE